MSDPQPTKRDYSETLFLPQTAFPMRAGLPQKEPEILKRWEEGRLYDRLRDASNAEVHDMAWSAAVRRTALDHRLVVQGNSAAALRDRLDRWLADDASAAGSGAAAGAQPKLVFVFCGQGAQFWNMGRGLLATNPAFRAVIEDCDALLRPLEGWSLLAELSRDEAAEAIANLGQRPKSLARRFRRGLRLGTAANE